MKEESISLYKDEKKMLKKKLKKLNEKEQDLSQTR
jgi:prefoldin subunit 5